MSKLFKGIQTAHKRLSKVEAQNAILLKALTDLTGTVGNVIKKLTELELKVNHPIHLRSGVYGAQHDLKHEPGKVYVIGVDPAREGGEQTVCFSSVNDPKTWSPEPGFRTKEQRVNGELLNILVLDRKRPNRADPALSAHLVTFHPAVSDGAARAAAKEYVDWLNARETKKDEPVSVTADLEIVELAYYPVWHHIRGPAPLPE